MEMITKEIQTESTSNVTITKQPLAWHFVQTYLELLHSFPEVMADKQFRKLFNKLKNYVNSLLDLTQNGDIEEMYVTIEQIENIPSNTLSQNKEKLNYISLLLSEK